MIQVDCVMASLNEKVATDQINVDGFDVVRGLNDYCLRSLGGIRIRNFLHAYVPNKQVFLQATLAIKGKKSVFIRLET